MSARFSRTFVRSVAVLLSLGLLFAMDPAHAQKSATPSNVIPDQTDGRYRMDLRPLGVALGYVHDIPPLIMHTPLKELCGIHVGCVLLVNQTKDWDITGFYLDVSDQSKGESPRWYNQFNGKLSPMKITGLPRMGDSRMTAVPLKIVWRNRKTKEETDALTAINLFDDPGHGVYVIYAKVVHPQVIVEPSSDTTTVTTPPLATAPH